MKLINTSSLSANPFNSSFHRAKVIPLEYPSCCTEIFCLGRLSLLWTFAQKQQIFVRAFFSFAFAGVLRLLSSSTPYLGRRRQMPTQGPDYHLISWCQSLLPFCLPFSTFQNLLRFVFIWVQCFQLYLMEWIDKSTSSISFWKEAPKFTFNL